MFKSIIYLISIPAISYVVAIIFRNLRKSDVKTKLFFGLAVTMELWVLSLGVADFTTNVKVALFCVNLAVFFISLTSWFFLFFCLGYLKRYSNAFLVTLSVVFSIFMLFVSLSEKFITSVSIDSYGAAIDSSTFVYLPAVIFIDLIIVYALGVLLKNKKKASKNIKTQINLITTGTVVILLGNLFGNEVGQYFPNLKFLIQISTLSSAFFVVIIAYTIIRHKLLDTREAAARSVTYLFTLSAVLLIYSVPMILVTRYILNIKLSSTSVVFFIGATFLIAAAFQPIKFFFNRMSNRLFFQEYFDPQFVLDQLGNILIGSTSLNEILDKSKSLLNDTLRPSKINYLIDSIETNQENKELIKLLDKSNLYLVNTEEDTDSIESELLEKLKSQGYTLSIRIRTNDQNLGYLLLGYRRSGNLYSFSDIRFLSIAVDEIAISLQNAINYVKIEKFNQELKLEVDEATSKLKSANQKLKIEDQNKDDFISMASHQLRTPLTSVKGYLSMVLDEDAGKINKVQREMLSQAFYGSSKMVYLISDLLNLSRLKSGKFSIEASKVNLAELVDQEIEQLRENIKSHRIDLIYRKPKDFPEINLDENKIRQVVMNFLDNAMYYTPEKGRIEVKLEQDGNTIDLKIIDSGIGVPKEEQAHLFTKFYRGSNAKKIRPDGTGIGLYMAKKIIIAHGGAVIFDSSINKGSTFGFKINKNGYSI